MEDVIPSSEPIGGGKNTLTGYIPLVEKVARRLSTSRHLPYNIKELVSYGVIGLSDALKKFDRKRGVKFKTYARLRIRGAILDGMRTGDWLPRSIRTKKKIISRLIYNLERQKKRAVTEKDLCEALGIGLDKYRKSYLFAKNTRLVSLEECYLNEEEGRPFLFFLHDKKAKDPLSIYEKEELKRTLARLIDKLPPRERMIISLHYYEELSIKKVASLIGLSKSNTTRLNSRAILKLRKGLKAILRYKIIP